MCAYWTPPPNYARKHSHNPLFDSLTSHTKVLHSRLPPLDPLVDPVTPPIYHSSTYRNHSVGHFGDILKQNNGFKRFTYQRLGNPTSETAELIINELEEGAGTLLFSSGLAAVTSVLTCFLKAGDHLICQRPMYGGSQSYIRETLSSFGIEITYLMAGCGTKEVAHLIRPNTRMIYGESPSNPDLSIMDIKEIAKLSKDNENLLFVIDGTFASPCLQQPIKHGADISLHSCSKYIGGHSDLIAGCVTLKSLELWRKLKTFQITNGTYLSSFDASLMIRGLKTLPLRVERQCANADKIAHFLEAHPSVVRVSYPGLKSHPQHEIAKKNMEGFGGMICFEMASKEAARILVERLRVIILAISLGSVESLIEHPASMTHGDIAMNDAMRKELGITDGLVRLSVGIEDVNDLISDLKQALDQVKNTLRRG